MRAAYPSASMTSSGLSIGAVSHLGLLIDLTVLLDIRLPCRAGGIEADLVGTQNATLVHRVLHVDLNLVFGTILLGQVIGGHDVLKRLSADYA